MSDNSLTTVNDATDAHAAATGADLAHSRYRSAKKAQRNLSIFKLVEIENFTHEEAAHRFKMHRSRVTQIVQQVRMDLAQAHPDDPHIHNHLARQRLERKLHKMRNQFALDALAQAIKRDPAILITNRAGTRGKGDQPESWSECIRRDRPKSATLFNTYLRVTRELGQINEREIASNRMIPEEMDEIEIFDAVANALSHWRDEAPRTDDPPSRPFLEKVDQFLQVIHTWLDRIRHRASSANAWPGPPPSEPKQHAQAVANTPAETNHDPGKINQAQPETNAGLTSFSDSSAATTHNLQTT